ncbi:MAG: alkaline phosphatase family protein [Acidimicrobiales bacterium]|jgi:phospholipase C
MADGNQLDAVEHIVVLMLENRSFDHMLGNLYADSGNVSPLGHSFEGLGGKEGNPDSGGNMVTAFDITATTPNNYFMPGADPGEGYVATNLQLFGSATAPAPAVATNLGFVTNFATTLTGADARRPKVPGTVPSDIMGIYTPEMLPVLSALARGFAVCDHWYASAPTETFPNRAFVGAATSQGRMDDAVSKFTCPSIFGHLGSAGLDWSIYGYDNAPLTRLNFPDTINAAESHFGEFPDFKAAAADGTLAPYAFLEPSWGSSGNSQHPNYDVALGEQLIHDVYYALRNSPIWDSSLLIILYDEHGGCYDHVAPPGGATPPDASPGEFGFDFTRFGVRVPAILVSPLIESGTVFRPSGPTPLDHTSILKTVETRWQLKPLSARDAAAPDVGDVLTLTQPRKDDPLSGVVPPTSSGTNPAAGTPSHIQEVHAQLVSQLPVDTASDPIPHGTAGLRTEHDYDDYIRTRTSAWVSRRGAK